MMNAIAAIFIVGFVLAVIGARKLLSRGPSAREARGELGIPSQAPEEVEMELCYTALSEFGATRADTGEIEVDFVSLSEIWLDRVHEESQASPAEEQNEATRDLMPGAPHS